MNKKVILATLGYLLTTFALGVTWHLFLFHEVYERLGVYDLEQPRFALGITALALDSPTEFGSDHLPVVSIIDFS